jgi:hypothetical protein
MHLLFEMLMWEEIRLQTCNMHAHHSLLQSPPCSLSTCDFPINEKELSSTPDAQQKAVTYRPVQWNDFLLLGAVQKFDSTQVPLVYRKEVSVAMVNVSNVSPQ